MSDAAIKARPTIYRGIQMRSRLEARVAAVFDAIDARTLRGPSWEYEPVAFADGVQQYLPDFRLWPTSTCHHCYVEVRPTYEGAWRAIDQMRVILASERDAILWVVYPSPWAGLQWSLVQVTALSFHPGHARDDEELAAWLYLCGCRVCEASEVWDGDVWDHNVSLEMS